MFTFRSVATSVESRAKARAKRGSGSDDVLLQMALQGTGVDPLWSTGTGSEVMRIAVPMIGGMVSSTVLTLVVIPAVYALVKGYGLPRRAPEPVHSARFPAPA